MTDRVRVGTMANMDADLLYRTKAVLSDGAIIEMVVWRLPSPVLGSSHLFEYSLFYGFEGQRIVGYDNEEEKATIGISTAGRRLTIFRLSMP